MTSVALFFYFSVKLVPMLQRGNAYALITGMCSHGDRGNKVRRVFSSNEVIDKAQFELDDFNHPGLNRIALFREWIS